MPWLRLDEEFYEHPKVLLLSDAAFRVHVNAMCYCARYTTDGVVPEAALRTLRGTPRLAKQLVGAGCWELHDDGWLIHDFLEYNPSKKKVDADRERRAASGRLGGLSKNSSKQEAGA